MEQITDNQKAHNQDYKSGGDSAIDFRYLVLKIEKLTAALHLVTGFLNNSDPIKYKLRDQGLVVLQLGLNFKYGPIFYKTAGIDDLKRAIDTLVSFITVALTDSSVSQMNLTILQKEYHDLYNYLDRYQINQESLVEKIELPKPGLAPSFSSKERGEHPNRSLRGGQGGVLSSVNTERREQILGYIKAHGWSPIADIAKAVPGVSDKTVQRELVALLNEGIILKKGDRRWARYNAA